MDQDDPEKRIAELERRLAEHRPVVEPDRRQVEPVDGPVMTPEQVRTVAFSKPPMGRRGYDEPEVDAFLNHVEAVLQDPTRYTLTPEQVRAMAFAKPPMGQRGYDESEVDAFLDRVEIELTRRRGQQSGVPQPASSGQRRVVFPTRSPGPGWRRGLRGLGVVFGLYFAFKVLVDTGVLAHAHSVLGLLLFVLLVVAVVFYVINSLRKARRRVRRGQKDVAS